MTKYKNSLEGGTNGTTLTAGNSGGASGDALSAVIISGGSLAFDSTRAAHGALSLKATPGNNAVNQAYYTINGTRVSIRAYVYFTAVPAGGMYALWLGVGGTRVVNLDFRPTGKVRVNDGAGTSGVYTSTSNYPLNEWVRVELDVTVGTTTSNGRIRFAMYQLDSTTPIDTPYDSSTVNTGTVALTRALTGAYSLVTDTTPFWVDDFATDDAATSFYGPVGNEPPVVTVGANQSKAAGDTVTLTSTATDSDGTIASRLWSFDYPTSGAPALTNATSASATFTAGAAGSLYVLRHTATDNSGATNSATMEVRVPSPNDLTPLPTAGTGGWSRVGSAATDGAALADSDDTTYMESPDITGTHTFRIRVIPGTNRSAFTETYRLRRKPGAGSCKATPRLMQGTTLIASLAAITLTESWADYPLTLTSGQLAAVTDTGNLWIEVDATL